jgi:hypothetical protein
MSKPMFVKCGSGARSVVVGTGAEDMVRDATVHASTVTDRIGALELGDRVGRVGHGARGGLIFLHGGFGGGDKRTGERRDVVVERGRSGWNDRWRWRWWPGGSIGTDGGEFEAASEGARDEFFLGTDEDMVTNSGRTEGAEGGKLSRTGSEGGKRGAKVKRVGEEEVLKVSGKAIEILRDKVEAPERNVRVVGQQRGEDGIFGKQIVSVEVDSGVTGSGVTVRHGEAFYGLDGGMKGGDVVAVGRTE